MFKKIKTIMIVCLSMMVIPSISPAQVDPIEMLQVAHSGGTDAKGCHAGKKPYHCHGKKPKAKSNK